MEQSLTDKLSLLNENTFRLSFDSEDEEAPVEPWYSLIRNLSCDQIQSLHTIFKEKVLRRKLSKSSETIIGLTKEEFVNAIDEVFGIGKYSFQATLLFDVIQKETELEVNWTNFINFMLKNLIPTSQSKILLGNPAIFAIPHVKRETIIKIVSIETDSFFCYAVISKHGHVGVYDGNMDFLTSYYSVMTREDILKDEKNRRRRNRWITDALFCKDAQSLLITNTTRSIAIYDASGMKHILLWLILSLPNVILCLCYHTNTSNGKGILFMGDDHGQVTSLTFFQPKNQLFSKRYNDKASIYYWLELSVEKQYVSIKNHGKPHSDFIRQIEYIEVNGSIITCSRDRKVSLANKHITNKREAYIFKMNRGADCFTLSNSEKYAITGSSDGIIRFWDLVIPSRPITILSGHRAGIVGLRAFDVQDALISCSRDANLKLWDIRAYSCVQNIKLNYPVFDVLGKSIEWGTTCIYLGPKRAVHKKSEASAEQPEKNFDVRSHILITCCNYMARIKLSYTYNSTIETELEMPILPPPPLQNSVLIPKAWKIDDNCETDNLELNPTVYDKNIEDHIKSLKFIIEKDLMYDFYNYREDINYNIAVLERKKLQMKENVARGAPFLALNLYEIEDIVLPSDLPIPNKKSIQTLVEKTRTMLSDAANRSQIFSEPSSSRSKSSRSSVVEFEC